MVNEINGNNADALALNFGIAFLNEISKKFKSL